MPGTRPGMTADEAKTAATSVAAYFNSSIGFGNYFTSYSVILDTRVAVGEALPLPS